MSNPFQVVKDFESALCEYAGSPYAVAVNSCTMALLLACKWYLNNSKDHWYDINGKKCIEIPKKTYCSVPMSIVHAGGKAEFRDVDWIGAYQLCPYPIFDSARWFTGNLYKLLTGLLGGGMVCVSFHASKTLGIEQGGAVLHDNPEADAWLRRMRFDGRTEGVAPKDDNFSEIGYHCYMSPSVAAQGLLKLHSLPKHNAPLPNDEYPDLSLVEIFK